MKYLYNSTVAEFMSNDIVGTDSMSEMKGDVGVLVTQKHCCQL